MRAAPAAQLLALACWLRPLHILRCLHRALNHPRRIARCAEAVDPELATTARADVEAKKQAKLIDKLASEWL